MTPAVKRGYSRAFPVPPPHRRRRYLLTDIPAGFWSDVRAKARRDGVSIRALLLWLVAAWLDGDVTIPKEFGR